MLVFSVIPVSADSGSLTVSTGPPLWLLLVAVLVPLTVIADLVMFRQVQNMIKNHAGTDGFGTWACQNRRRFYMAVAITMTFILVALPLFVVRQLLLLLSNNVKQSGGMSLFRAVQWIKRICQTQIVVPISSLKRAADFLSTRLVRGAILVLAAIICICAAAFTVVFFGLATAFQTGIVVLAVLCVVAIVDLIARAMKDGFTFNSLILGYETGFGSGHDDLGSTTNSRGTGASSGHVDPGRGHKTNAKMSGFFPFTLVHHGKIQIPTSDQTTKLNAINSQTDTGLYSDHQPTSSSSVFVSGADVKTNDGT